MRSSARSFEVATIVAGALFTVSVAASCGDDSNDSSVALVDAGGAADDALTPSTVPPSRAEFGLDARPSNTTCLAPARPPAALPVKLERIWNGVTLVRPMWMAQPPGDPSRWFVASRDGTIVAFPAANPPAVPPVVASVPALSGKPILEDFEGGFFAFAFHPKFGQNGRVYVTFTTSGDAGGLASEVGYITSTNGGASFGSYTRLIHFSRPRLEHNGGGLAFGKDGYLYLSFGDGTSAANGQSKTGWFAKVHRIDVDDVPPGKTFGIPPTNPFAAGGGEPTIFARGFRNPFRISIDRATGDLWLGDVGESDWEEVNRVSLGGNHGWPCREGAHDAQADDPLLCPSTAGLVDPIVEHSHAPTPSSRSVTGGVVYRGPSMPAFQGTYVYADFIRLEAWALSFDPVTGEPVDQLINADGPQAGFSGFHEDDAGEIYVTALFQDAVFRLVPTGPAPPSTFPERLSKTGCVDPADPKRPAPGLVPFGVNAPLWSDAADKERYLALPDGKTIDVREDGDFDLPVGSVLVKTFSIGNKPIETRLLVRHDDGEWAGYSYEWDEAAKDATLLHSGKTKAVSGRTWTFPSRTDCIRCHTQGAGRTLGLELGQLNGDLVYAQTNRVANQLRTLEHIGMFSQPLGRPPSDIVAYAGLASSAPLEARARSYLHGNCSGCHRPSGGAARAAIDLRYGTPLPATQTCGVASLLDDLGVAGAAILAPGAPDKSILYLRPRALDQRRMPPLASRLVDEEGTKVIGDWIRGMSACP